MAWGKYRMTPARLAAIRKAQAASASKRRGTGKKKASTGRKRKSVKARYQKGHSGAGAIHRRRKAQWNSGKKRDKAKVIAKSFNNAGAMVHAVSYARDQSRSKAGQAAKKGKGSVETKKQQIARKNKKSAAKIVKRANRSKKSTAVRSGAIGLARRKSAQKKVAAARRAKSKKATTRKKTTARKKTTKRKSSRKR